MRRQRAGLQEALRRLEEEAGRIVRRRIVLQESIAERERQDARQSALRARKIQEQMDRLQELERIREELRAVESALEELERHRARARPQLDEAEAEVARAREAAAQARAQLDYWQSYAEKFLHQREERDEDLQALLSAGLPGVMGRLMDFLEIEPGWETAVAAMLGPLLPALVVRDSAALERIRPRVRRSLPVVVLEALRFERGLRIRGRMGKGIALPAGKPALPARPAMAILRAREPRLQAWLERHLEGVWLTDTWEQAIALWPQLPRTAQVLTRDGERIGGEGILWIGRYTAPEGVWLAQEWMGRSPPEQLEAARQASRQAEEILQASLARWKQAHEEWRALEEGYRTAIARREELQRRIRGLEEELQDIARSLQSLEREIAEGDPQRAQMEAEQGELERRLGSLQEEQRALEAAREEIDREIAALGLERIEADLARLRAEERLLEEQRRRIEEMIAQHEETLRELETERMTLSMEVDDSTRTALEAERASLQRLRHMLDAYLRDTEARRAQEMAALLTAESEFEEAWKQVELLREAGRSLEERVHAARLEVVRWEGEVHAFEQALREEWRHLDDSEMDLEAWIQGADAAEPLEALEARVESLRQALRRLGPINPEAAAEYAAMQERHAFLTSQIADLEAAAASFQQTIAALDQQMQRAFMETFRAAGRAFRETFVELFGGGNARLTLTESESWDQAGVEIFVRVPGKRTQSLMMLSGGEKALTATALIFALLKVRPSPFVVLDEADAALDEANVGRFREMIRRLSGRTQFILITHNRGTVEAADVLYGVTLRPDGTSQVLSLRLEEAERIMQNKRVSPDGS